MNWIKKFILWLLPKKKKVIPNPDARVGGVEKSPPDSRDYKPSSSTMETSLPTSYTLRPLLSRVENQGSFNSCVAHAITTALETLARVSNYPTDLELSRMHLWNMGRQETYGDDWRKNSGVYIRDAWKRAQSPGVTIEKLFPYTPENDGKTLHFSWIWAWYPPFKYVFINRYLTKASKEKEIKNAIVNWSCPVVFGIRVGTDFQLLRLPNEPYSGGDRTTFAHAMCIVGWDDSKDSFLIMNSWGTRWGNNGFLWARKEWILDKAFDLSYAEVEQQ